MFTDTELTKFRYRPGVPNPGRKPGVVYSPAQVEWYQDWTAPSRWVTCEVIAGRDDAVHAYFWTKPEWDKRETRVVSMDDPAKFAAALWEFLKPLPAEETTSRNP